MKQIRGYMRIKRTEDGKLHVIYDLEKAGQACQVPASQFKQIVLALGGRIERDEFDPGSQQQTFNFHYQQ